MFFRLGLLVLLMAMMPFLVQAGGTDPEDRQYDEFGNMIELNTDGAVAEEGESEALQSEPDIPKMFDSSIGGGIGYGSLLGEFYSGFDSGPFYFGEIRLAVSPKTYLKFGYRNMEIYQASHGLVDPDGANLGTVDLSVFVHTYTLSVGWLSLPNPKKKLRIYAEIGGGYANHVITADIGSESISDGEAKFMLVSQIGLLVPIGNGSIGLDVGGSIMMKSLSGAQNEGVGAVLGGHVGLVILIGGAKE
jgi:hypothetical protein